MAFRGENTARQDNKGINTSRLGKNNSQQPQTETYEEKIARLDREARLEQIEKEEAAEKRAKKNKDFVQYSEAGLRALAQIKKGSSLQILHWMTAEMGKDNALIVSQDTIAEALDLSIPTIQRSIKTLIDAQILLMVKVGGGIIYHLNSTIVWKSWATNKKYAKFSAQVILGEKEYKQNLERKLIKSVSKKQGKLELE